MRWTGIALAILVGPGPESGLAQARATFGVAAIGVASSDGFAGVGGVALVPLGSELRLGGLGAVGVGGGKLAGRGEIALHLGFAPVPPKRWGWFVGGGIAGEVGPGRAGYLLATVGVERATGRTGMLWLEAGVGGGPRLVLGYRVRRRGR